MLTKIVSLRNTAMSFMGAYGDDLDSITRDLMAMYLDKQQKTRLFRLEDRLTGGISKCVIDQSFSDRLCTLACNLCETWMCLNEFYLKQTGDCNYLYFLFDQLDTLALFVDNALKRAPTSQSFENLKTAYLQFRQTEWKNPFK